MSLDYFIADVFAFENYTGNQLAVFINDGSIADKEMQLIAKEINFSETTFVQPGIAGNGGFNTRIFTPKSEVDFAGHPTLGTAYIIRKYILKNNADSVKLNLKVGEINVSFENEIWMRQIEPVFGKKYSAEEIAPVINLSEEEIDTKFPVEEVSTGLPFTIVPLKNMESLKNAKTNPDKYWLFAKAAWGKGILIFCPEGYTKDQSIAARVFVDYVGIPEDPATGSANGCLAGYFVKNKYFGKDEINLKVGQGYEMNRPSQLFLKAKGKNGAIEIFVGGNAFEVASGKWNKIY